MRYRMPTILPIKPARQYEMPIAQHHQHFVLFQKHGNAEPAADSNYESLIVFR